MHNKEYSQSTFKKITNEKMGKIVDISIQYGTTFLINESNVLYFFGKTISDYSKYDNVPMQLQDKLQNKIGKIKKLDNECGIIKKDEIILNLERYIQTIC